MTLLNVSFGIFAFMPLGWLFMAFVIIIECLTLTRFLNNKWYDKIIYRTATITNIISGIIGIIISMVLNGGWWLVVWFPWVSAHDVYTPGETPDLTSLYIYYAGAFVLTLIIETTVNILFLRKHYPTKKILLATLLTNIISYAVGTIVLYSYSFN